MKRFRTILTIFLIVISIQLFSQQASLTIINKSDRNMTVKIMKGMGKKATLFKTEYVSPKGKQITYFSETGKYYTKTMAVLIKEDTLNNDTIYNKSNPFNVISDKRRGYSNITLKFKVKESKRPMLNGTIPISRKEYVED